MSTTMIMMHRPNCLCNIPTRHSLSSEWQVPALYHNRQSLITWRIPATLSEAKRPFDQLLGTMLLIRPAATFYDDLTRTVVRVDEIARRPMPANHATLFGLSDR
jgi:hypothetical protein